MNETMNNVDMQKRTKVTSFKTILGYSSGYFGYGFVTQMMTSYLFFYASVVLDIPGGLIGLVISISVIWDAISDPMMGYISDKTVTRFGRRHIYIVLGTISIVLTNLLLWNVNTSLEMKYKFIWILLAVVLIKTGVTIFVTPYSALGAEMSHDYNERTKIQGTKSIFFLSAFITVAAICMFVFFRPTQAYPIGQMNPNAYRNISILSSVVMILTGYITYVSTKKYIPIIEQLHLTNSLKKVGENNATKKSLKSHSREFMHMLKFCMTLDDYRHIFFGYLYTNLASAVIGVVGLHTFTYTFQMNNDQIGIVLGTQFLVCILVQPFWIKLASIKSKLFAVITGLSISILGCLILFALTLFRSEVIAHFEYLIFYACVIGFGTSGLFSIPLSMVADTVDEQEYISGERNEGVFYGMLNFGYKMSQSIAIFFLGILLDLINFDASLSVQKPLTAIFLGVILSIGSLFTFVLAIVVYRKYSADESKIRMMQEKIKERIDNSLQ